MRGFTEAVPLSLSSMAHMTMPLEEGVVDGIKQVLQHTLLSCVNYARAMIAPCSWTFSDLGTSAFAWRAPPEASKINISADLPPALQKLGFQHVYPRTCFIYLKRKDVANHGMPTDYAQELALIPTAKHSKPEKEWTHHPNILGKISLLYATQELMTPGELNGTEGDEDTPPCVLYKVAVEYRSLPATGNRSAVQAEELSMLSFGGSVDDDVKYGALASLYDAFAKYVLEIYSVRGKKYKFDLMDSTLSNGTVPRLPSKPVRSAAAAMPGRGGTGGGASGAAGASASATSSTSERPSKRQATEDANHQDPFVKSLCVTVTDHHEAQPPPIKKEPGIDVQQGRDNTSDDNNNNNNSASAEGGDASKADDTNVKRQTNSDGSNVDGGGTNSNANATTKSPSYAITRIHLTMEGQLRTKDLKQLPNFHAISETIQACFLSLRARPPQMATCSPSGHTLLLDPKEAGRVYIHGRYITTWSKDPRIACVNSGPALFGMHLHSVPLWHGRIFDYDLLKRNYATLWQEILIDARWMPLEISARLLARLSTGRDPPHIRAATRRRLQQELKEAKAASKAATMNQSASADASLQDQQQNGGGGGMGDGQNGADSNDGNADADDDEEDDDEEDSAPISVKVDCLETQVMKSLDLDPVGISARALATRFKMHHGPDAFPCRSYEVNWVKERLPHKTPVVVPARLIAILGRGGYHSTQRTIDESWFAESRKAQGAAELALLRMALTKLIDAGVTDVSLQQIVFATTVKSIVPDPLSMKHGIVRRNAVMKQYHVHEGFLTCNLSNGMATSEADQQDMRAYILGFHIAQEHPDGNVLTRYLMRNKK